MRKRKLWRFKLGISFNKYYIKENKIKYPRISGHHIRWYANEKAP